MVTTMVKKKTSESDIDIYHKRKVAPHLPRMPWMLRITDHKKRPSPVLVIKYRRYGDEYRRYEDKIHLESSTPVVEGETTEIERKAKPKR